MMGTRRLAVLAGLLALTAGACPQAEAQDVRLPRPFGQAYLLVGGVSLDLSGINASLGGQGYEPIGEETASLGGGAHTLLGRWLLGLEGFGYLPREADRAPGDWRARLSGGGGVFNVGYTVARLGGTSVYPVLGVGGGALTLQMMQRGSPRFDEVLANPGRRSTLHRTALIVQPALGMDHFIPVGAPVGARTGVVVGVRGGYAFTPFTSGWYLHMDRLAASPEQGMEGPFLRVLVGAGHRRIR
jgi:hypothetical protein